MQKGFLLTDTIFQKIKKPILLIGIFLFLVPIQSVFASNDSNHAGAITLDQFHNVIFEQFSSSTYALNLLQAKKQFSPTDLVIGGSAEGDLQYWRGDPIAVVNVPQVYHQSSAAYFTQATVDAMMNIYSWNTIFLSGSESGIWQSGSSANYYYSPRAFYLFGNLEQFPVFFTAGSNTIPFGQFVGAGVWNRPLTLNYFFPQQAPQLSLGFHTNHWDLNATNFRDQVLFETHSAYSLKYSNDFKSLKYGIGAGYLTNINLNMTGAPGLVLRKTPIIANLNAGNLRDINASLQYQLTTFLGEYLEGAKSVSNNNQPPNAFSLTLNYMPNIKGTDYTFGINYSKANHLAGVPAALPGQDQLVQAAAGIKNAWALSVSRNFTKWFVIGLAAERDVTYTSEQTYAYTLDVNAYL
jgi:hypothetical protein